MNILLFFLFLLIAGILLIYSMLPTAEMEKKQVVEFIINYKLFIISLHSILIFIVIKRFIPFFKKMKLLTISKTNQPQQQILHNFVTMFCSIWTTVAGIITIVYISILPVGAKNIYTHIYNNLNDIDFQFAMSSFFTSFISLFFFFVLISLKQKK